MYYKNPINNGISTTISSLVSEFPGQVVEPQPRHGEPLMQSAKQLVAFWLQVFGLVAWLGES